VVVYPDGIWYSQVKEADVATIIDEHIKKGTPPTSLKPDSVWGG
jgi:(2Fe-2S) ferredoxin